MFWTEHEKQLRLDGSEEPVGPTCIVNLVSYSMRRFPNHEKEFHRQFAFLTHQATLRFLLPMLLCKYKTLEDARVPTLAWLDAIGSFETLARSVRDSGRCRPSPSYKSRPLPDWYEKYLKTTHYSQVKDMARLARLQMAADYESLHCSLNASHAFEVWHHCDYSRLGCGDEFRCLVPLCNECHDYIRVRGPGVPREIPEGVKQWL